MGKKDGSIQEISGYLKATENFSGEAVDTEGTDIGFVDAITLPDVITCKIINKKNGHKHVLELAHNGSVGSPDISHNITAISDGVFEFYWGCNDINEDDQLRFVGSLGAIILSIKDSKYQYQDSEQAWHEATATPTNGKLDHHKIVFHCATNIFDWYINEDLQFSGAEFRTEQSSIIKFTIQLTTKSTNNIVYFDAWGNTDDANYTEGDNLTFETGAKDGSIAEI